MANTGLASAMILQVKTEVLPHSYMLTLRTYTQPHLFFFSCHACNLLYDEDLHVAYPNFLLMRVL